MRKSPNKAVIDFGNAVFESMLEAETDKISIIRFVYEKRIFIFKVHFYLK